MDKRTYRLPFKEKGKCVAAALILTAALAYLFYDSVWGMILFPAVYFLLHRRSTAQGFARMQERIGREFLDVLRTVSSSLLAGLSMEHAWQEAGKELTKLYGKDSILGKELAGINRRVGLNFPLEQELSELAERSGNPDIVSFAEVFAFAKRSGGSFSSILEGTAEHIRAQFETEREIQVLVAAKRLEQNIMNVVPLFILLYMKLTSPGFLDVLYKNPAGVLFMSVCLLAYGGAFLLAEHILMIKM